MTPVEYALLIALVLYVGYTEYKLRKNIKQTNEIQSQLIAYLSRAFLPQKGVLDSERSKIFNKAMSEYVNPEHLRRLANAFESEELPAQAKALRLRAIELESPPQ